MNATMTTVERTVRADSLTATLDGIEALMSTDGMSADHTERYTDCVALLLTMLDGTCSAPRSATLTVTTADAHMSLVSLIERGER